MNHKPTSSERYSRQTLVWGEEQQRKLGQSKVAIVGMGALGTVAAELLVRAGVEKMLVVDRDIVEESNLQRQVLYDEQDVGRSKALAAQEKLRRINLGVELAAAAIHLGPDNVEVLQSYDLILDGTDNLQTRLLLNDFCRKEKIPWVYAAAIRTAGYVMPIAHDGPCLRCFLKEESLETCDTVGILNTTTSAVASLQAVQALKLLLGEPVESTLFHIDLWKNTWRTLKVKRNPSCRTCRGLFDCLDQPEDIRVVQFCSAGRYQIQGRKVDLPQLKERWQKIDMVRDDRVMLQFREIALFADGRALINAASEQEARSLYSKWVGN